MFRRSGRNLKSNIAQVMLVFLLFPIIMGFCYIFSSATDGSTSASLLLSMFGNVPVCGVAFDMISQYVAFGSEVKIAEITSLLFLKAFPETMIVGVACHFFISLFQREWKIYDLSLTGEPVFSPLPIFPTFLGLVTATIFVGLLNLFKNQMITFLSELLLVAIMIFGIKLMFGKRFDNGIFGIKKILTLVIDGLYAVIFSAYIASMVVVGSGSFQSFKEAFAFEATMVGSIVIATCLHHFIRKVCKNFV